MHVSNTKNFKIYYSCGPINQLATPINEKKTPLLQGGKDLWIQFDLLLCVTCRVDMYCK